MPVKVFLLGRPGSGKTTTFQYLKKLANKEGWNTTRFREYAILREMYKADRKKLPIYSVLRKIFNHNFKNKFLPAAHDGFDVCDFSVFSLSAKRLEKKIKKHLTTAQANQVIFIELARDDYSEAMRCFSPEFLRDSYFLFIEAPVETCIQRIHWRVAHPKKTDGHFISDHILKSYYAKDNLNYMASCFQEDYSIEKAIRTIQNTGTLKDLKKKLAPFASEILFRKPDHFATQPNYDRNAISFPLVQDSFVPQP